MYMFNVYWRNLLNVYFIWGNIEKLNFENKMTLLNKGSKQIFTTTT